ncbi:hypothetical protein, partial [Mitsuokella jalaludinii]|uniref:hypothetical protein n=1 Tax=Mitsuokella jalaludinii TaxID=187979 RepID=UPI003078D9AA
KQVLDAAGQSSAYGQSFPCFRGKQVDRENARYLEDVSSMPGILYCADCMTGSSGMRVLAELMGVKSSGGIHKWSFSLPRGTLDTPR